jgi:hypothetical protein
MKLAILATLVSTVLSESALPRRCPTSASLQSASLSSSFSLTKFATNERFYEIAYKDATQPRMCTCITSEKRVEGDEVLDKFTIQCAGKPFSSDLHFGITDAPGVFEGTWKQGTRFSLTTGDVTIPLIFPDTVVEVGVNPKTKEYDWVVEFQCVEGGVWTAGGISFYAFNFYSRVNTLEFYDAMLEVFIIRLILKRSQRQSSQPFWRMGMRSRSLTILIAGMIRRNE